MTIVLSGLLACVCYLAGAGLQLIAIRRAQPAPRHWVIGLGLLGLLFHGIVIWQEIFTARGINLSLMPMISLMFFAATAGVLLSSLRRPVENLMIGLFPLAAAAILLSFVLQSSTSPRGAVSEGFVVHIILSVIAYSLLTIAALQAALLAFGDYELRHHRLSVMRALPPLQTMEGLLFELLSGGLVFLSLSIVTGFFYLNRDSGAPGDSPPGLIHHTVITLAAWAVFSVLLWGRYRLGWRGQTASRWTLSGFALLVLGYFGSKFVLEVILGRG